MPHADCSEMHPGPLRQRYIVCQPCFFRWVHGDIRADNIGFRHVRCQCGTTFSHEEIRSILAPDQFEEYDAAMTKAALESAVGDVLYCPGPDCPNVFIKAPRTRSKRQCRKAVCEENDGGCGTTFCGLCGELYTKEHQRMKCGPYKKWKHTNDEDTIQMREWREAAEVKGCPRCKRDVEKRGGCRSMQCTNCRCKFCWDCGQEFRQKQRCGCSSQ